MVTKEDFYYVSWSQYEKAAIEISQKIHKYCSENDITITHIVPILRGGGVLGIHLSHMLNVTKVNTCQYKYVSEDKKYVPMELLAPRFEKEIDRNACILVTEGNHCSGATAQKCINSIRQLVSEVTILYASLARDANHLKPMEGTVYEVYGFLSNESKAFSPEYCKKNNIPDKFSIFPWESVEEEIREINNSRNNYQ